MTKFDPAYDPPAPIAKIAVKAIEIELGVEPSDKTYELAGFDGHVINAEIYQLQVIFLVKRFTGNYCSVDGPIGIIGRDILNQNTILFDGPSLDWDEVASSSIK